MCVPPSCSPRRSSRTTGGSTSSATRCARRPPPTQRGARRAAEWQNGSVRARAWAQPAWVQVLELVSSHHLFLLFPLRDEGELSELRSGVVNKKVVAHFSRQLGLDALLLRGGQHTDEERAATVGR